MKVQTFNIVQYTKGSYIILENESKNGCFYIIQSGSIKITYENPIIGQMNEEIISKGDFFGVIGCMSQLPHYETAFSVTPVVLIAVSFHGFSDLIKTNTALALKIVRSYSKKLRIFNDRSDSSNQIIDDLRNLIKYAEYYETTEFLNIAIYMYKSFLYNFKGSSPFVEKAKNKLLELESDEEFPNNNEFVRQYMEGEVIFCEGEPGSSLYIIQRGKVRVSKISESKDSQLQIMREGDIIGEMALLENKFRSATAVALEKTSLLNISKSNFAVMVEKEPQLMTKIIALLSERIWTTSKHIRNSRFQNINSRILDLLYILVQKNKIKISSKVAYNFNITFPELLSMLDIREDMESIINKFLNIHKLFKIDENLIYCHDLSHLERQANAIREKQ